MHKYEHIGTHIYTQVYALKVTQKKCTYSPYMQSHTSLKHALTFLDIYIIQTHRYTYLFTLAHAHAHIKSTLTHAHSPTHSPIYVHSHTNTLNIVLTFTYTYMYKTCTFSLMNTCMHTRILTRMYTY